MTTNIAYRYDFAPMTRAELEQRNNTLAYATVCRDGILTYFTGGGKEIKELRPSSANRQPEFLERLYNLPIVVEHPPVKLMANPDHPLKVGNIKEVEGYKDHEGNVGVYIEISDPAIRQKVLNGDYSDVSLGYSSTIIDTPDGIYYDPIDDITYVGDFQRVQIGIKPDHLAITKFGRAGSDVRIFPHLQKLKKDSLSLDEIDIDVYNVDDDHLQTVRFDSYLTAGITIIPTNGKADRNCNQSNHRGIKQMTTNFRRDSIEFANVPQDFANWVHERLDAMEEIYRQLGEKQAENEQLQDLLAKTEAEKQQNAGRADALEEVCEQSVLKLAKRGLVWDANAHRFVRMDGYGKKNLDMEDEDMEDMEDEDMEDMTDEDLENMSDEDMEAMPEFIKKKLMAKRKEQEERTDAIQEAIAQGILVRSQALGLLDYYHVDSAEVDLNYALNPYQVMVNTIAAIKPNTTLYDNPAYIQAKFDSLVEQVQDSEQDHSSKLQKQIGRTRQDSVSDIALPQINENYKKPLRYSSRSSS